MVFFVLAQVVSWVCQILIVILIVRSVLSWFVFYNRRYNSGIGRVYQILSAFTEPIVAPVRRIISRFVNTGPIDFAPLAAFFLIMIVRWILVAILLGLAALV